MIPAFVQELGITDNKVAGTTLALTTTGATTAGNLIVARFVFDNAAVASKPIVSSITKQAGETANWALLGAARSTSTTSGAFASGEMWCIRTTVAWAAAAYTVTLDTSVTQKSMAFTEFSGAEAIQRSTVGTAYSTTTTAATATTTGTTPQANDLVVGLMFQSNAQAFASSDTDTSGGSWAGATLFGSTGGSAATCNFGRGQYKVLTSATHQTYNAAAALTAGNGVIVAILQFVLDPAITQASYRLYADGTESGSTALAAQDTAYTANMDSGDVNLGLRTRLQSTNVGVINATDDWLLQWEKNANGTWLPATTEVLATSYDGEDQFELISKATNGQQSLGQQFAGTGQPISRAGWRLSKAGTPTGNLTCLIYASSLALGNNTAIPTGTALSTATTVISIASLTTTSGWVYFTFDGSFTPANGTPYFLVVHTDQTPSDTNNVRVGSDFSSSTASGVAALQTNAGGWITSGSTDFSFEVYVNPTTPAVPYDSANLTDGAATTNRLGAGTGSFVAGKVSEDSLVDDLSWTVNNYTEVLYSLTIKAAAVVNADTLRFRVLRNGATTGMTYTQTPTINVTKAFVAVLPVPVMRPTLSRGAFVNANFY